MTWLALLNGLVSVTGWLFDYRYWMGWLALLDGLITVTGWVG